MSKRYTHTIDIHNTNAAEEILPFVLDIISPRSVIDVGCGLGTWLKVAQENGVEIIQGVDGEIIDEKLLSIDSSKILFSDFNKPIEHQGKYDLVISLEVAEHLYDENADVFINSLISLGDNILFSAAVPGQGGQNHHNEQWPEYWSEKFNSYGYKTYDIIRPNFWENEKVEWWYQQNIILFSKLKLNIEPSSDIKTYISKELYLKKLNIERSHLAEISKYRSMYESLLNGSTGIRQPFRALLLSIKNKIFGTD